MERGDRPDISPTSRGLPRGRNGIDSRSAVTSPSETPEVFGALRSGTALQSVRVWLCEGRGIPEAKESGRPQFVAVLNSLGAAPGRTVTSTCYGPRSYRKPPKCGGAKNEVSQNSIHEMANPRPDTRRTSRASTEAGRSMAACFLRRQRRTRAVPPGVQVRNIHMITSLQKPEASQAIKPGTTGEDPTRQSRPSKT